MANCSLARGCEDPDKKRSASFFNPWSKYLGYILHFAHPKDKNNRDLQAGQLGGATAEVNKTLTEATVIMKKLDTPKANLAKIELLVCLTALLLICLTIWGSSRRRHNRPVLKHVLWAAHTLSSYLVTYTLGLMTAASFRNDLFPVWAAFLLIFFGSPDSFSAYSLEDNEKWKNYAWQCLIKTLGVVTLLIVYVSTSPMYVGVAYLLMIVHLKVIERATSLRTASVYGLQRSTKLIADYMSSEHQPPNPPDPDPILMTGYRYVVGGEEKGWVSLAEFTRKNWNAAAQKEVPYHLRFPFIRKKWKEEQAQARMLALIRREPLEITDEVITVDKVWACDGNLLSSTGGDEDGKLKDICLSFSLYKLLSLRFGGYSLPKEAHQKTWKLIQNGLLANENGFERAFRVVELELSFLFDLFYTNYPIIFYPGRPPFKLMVLTLFFGGSLSIIVACFSWYCVKIPVAEIQLATLGGLSIDVLVTAVILVVFICLELVQLHFVDISEWAKVSLLCEYVRKTSWHGNEQIEKRIGRTCRKSQKPWERKLHQYSILESHGYTPPRWKCNGFTATYIHPTRDGRQQSAPIELSSEVKKAVLDSLISNHEELKNGKASLERNNVDQLSWACELKTQTRVIFAWHIATSICEQEVRISHPNFFVATHLSKYVAYLAVFCPKLLPDHPFDAECTFDQIILDTRDLLQGCKPGEERIEKLKETGRTEKLKETGETTDNDSVRVINQGARLGHELLQLKEEGGPELIWKVLADFWAELMVYVAPSDDAKAHAEHLATGGEFVTHLWALATHGDIRRP